LVPARGIQHVDLAVEDVERSLAFYYALLEPLGLKEKFRNRTYRHTEEVIYLDTASRGLGYALRTAVSTGTTRWGSSTSPSR
jgi:catechol 2,3-dioxygenase-like lactoylglutathione lyase family enzyme